MMVQFAAVLFTLCLKTAASPSSSSSSGSAHNLPSSISAFGLLDSNTAVKHVESTLPEDFSSLTLHEQGHVDTTTSPLTLDEEHIVQECDTDIKNEFIADFTEAVQTFSGMDFEELNLTSLIVGRYLTEITRNIHDQMQRTPVRIDRDDEPDGIVSMTWLTNIQLDSELWHHDFERMGAYIKTFLPCLHDQLLKFGILILLLTAWCTGVYIALNINTDLPAINTVILLASSMIPRLAAYFVILINMSEVNIGRSVFDSTTSNNLMSIFVAVESIFGTVWCSRATTLIEEAFGLGSFAAVLVILVAFTITRLLYTHNAEVTQRHCVRHLISLRRYSAVLSMELLPDLPPNIVECVICLQPMNIQRLPVISLPCDHCFHRACMLQWVQQQRGNTCPYCRHVFREDEDEWVE